MYSYILYPLLFILYPQDYSTYIDTTKMFRAIRRASEKYPILRGMATYSVLWPTSNLVQQSMDKTREKYDPMESLRYLVLGTFATAPTVYVWVKLAGKIVRGNALRHAIMKVRVCVCVCKQSNFP